MAFLLGEVRRPRYMFAYHFDLSSISRVTPDAGPTAMQQVGQYLAVMHVSRRRSHRADECALAVHPDVRLHAKIPLAAFVRSMHIRLSLPVLVLRRNRSVDIDGIRDGAGIHLHPILMRILGDPGQTAGPQGWAVSDGCKTYRSSSHSQFVQRLFHYRIQQIEPVSQK